MASRPAVTVFLRGVVFMVSLGSTVSPAAPTSPAVPAHSAGGAPTTQPKPWEVRADRPRLLLRPDRLKGLRAALQEDDTLRSWVDQLRTEADRILKRPALTRDIADGVRLLPVSRELVRRVRTLSLVFLLTNEHVYAQAAIEHLLVVSDFSDWNPSHFLDVAEMAAGVAVGYDWLHHHMTEQQRATVRQALIAHALEPGRLIYEGRGEPAWSNWWPTAHHNWNQVCNGGLILAALAIGDEHPQLAREVVTHARKSLSRAMGEFGPDGACVEGPGYWRYAMEYTVLLLAGLESATGQDLGLLDAAAGLDRSALFVLHMTGPSGRTFNFADCTEGSIQSPELLWLASRFRLPAAAEYRCRQLEQGTTPTAMDVIWGAAWTESAIKQVTSDPTATTKPGLGVSEAVVSVAAEADGPQRTADGLPLDAYFRRIDVVSMRSGRDRAAWWVGFKGGDNRFNHGHLDLGTFVLEYAGHRFASDLGPDNYNLPGFWDGKTPQGRRWQHYRLRAEGHNTLVIRPHAAAPAPTAAAPAKAFPPAWADQDPAATAPITNVCVDQPLNSWAVADLTRAYPHASSVRRGVMLQQRQRVVVQDELACDRAADVWWFMHTPANINLSPDGRQATLTLADATLVASLTLPEDAVFSIEPARPLPDSPDPAGQAANDHIRKLCVALTAVRQATIRVVFHASTDKPPSAVTPLSDW